MMTQRFGIEIEMTGISRALAGSIIADIFHTENQVIDGIHKTYEILDQDKRKWKVVHDSSIVAERLIQGINYPADESYKIEIVSPILNYSNIESLKEIIKRLEEKGAMVNNSCGIHIHLDAMPHNPNTLKNLVNIIASKEHLIHKALQIPKERLRYCKKVNNNLIEMINKEKPKSITELADIWYKDYPYDNRNIHRNHSRYRGLNLHSTFTKGTVEFRLFNATLNPTEIKSIIQFCMAVNHQALTQKKTTSRRTVIENEKYAFRCWMLRLGLIGDEFKDCRSFFIKNLEGNSAWRNNA